MFVEKLLTLAETRQAGDLPDRRVLKGVSGTREFVAVCAFFVSELFKSY